LDGQGDAPVEPLDGLVLEVEVEPQGLDRVLAEAHGAQPLQVGVPLEVEDPVDDLVGVLHLVDGLLAGTLGEALEAPVAQDPVVAEVLVDRGQLGREDVVEQLDDLGATLGHGCTSGCGTRTGWGSPERSGRGVDGLALPERGEEHPDRRSARPAAGAGPAVGADVLDVERPRLDGLADGAVVHPVAVADDHASPPTAPRGATPASLPRTVPAMRR